MKKIYVLCLIIGLMCVVATAQKISKPTQTPAEPNEAQREQISKAIQLHDKRQFDEAISIYKKVLEECPNCVLAIYEIAFSYYVKGNFDEAMNWLEKGAQYKSPVLPKIYRLIGSIVDDKGDSKKALEFYKEALKLAPDDPVIHYDMGVTLVRLKQYKEARESLKKAVELDFSYASPHYLLAEVFYGTKYKVPALLSAARLITLELNSNRTKRSVDIFLGVMNAAKKDEKDNSVTIFLDLNAPKDEGDFTAYDLILGTLLTVEDEKEKELTQEERFAKGVDTMIALFEEDKKLRSTFIGKTYIPFVSELKRQGYSKTFAYLVLQQNGNKIAEKWLLDNKEKTIEFIDWSRTYQPTKK